MNWNRQALEAWLEEAARNDEDMMIIYKYSSEDDGRIKVTYCLGYLQAISVI